MSASPEPDRLTKGARTLTTPQQKRTNMEPTAFTVWSYAMLTLLIIRPQAARELWRQLPWPERKKDEEEQRQALCCACRSCPKREAMKQKQRRRTKHDSTPRQQ